MNSERLKEIAERHDKSTDGPWQTRFIYRLFKACRDHQSELKLFMDGNTQTDWNDADFIANAHADIPDLLAHIRQLEEEVGRLREALTDISKRRDETPSCNRHVDCNAADVEYEAKHGTKPGFNFHCHDECCEDCFGS